MKKDIRLELKSINDINELREYLEKLCKLDECAAFLRNGSQKWNVILRI